ncbi:DNA/RNA non-specific endonuclease [Aquiflexum sp. LQ15W]|uniref:DNA/RNA non-specific endonuclease n=1 Tax=Cognataquiflexum nitidum TaxID=2922272 RepID=UPI001F1476F6|nr:DNA/RNA non-specific endonuclease [Cognataquiflexum nitidum]MCH6200011.1 DNA/RNA non-specific endonuclease [Cognataquiflexum nitidum]
MAKSSSKPKGKYSQNINETAILMDKLKTFVRTRGSEFLSDRNINSIGIGYKIKDGKETDQICIQFTVSKKMENISLESIGSAAIPETIQINGISVPTDVVQRSFKLSFQIVPEPVPDSRKTRINPIVPGISVGHKDISAGTIGCIVFDKNNGTPYILSNWHVLQGVSGQVGDIVVQPGPHDDNRINSNRLGKLVRSHLGHAGDCAIASIEDRTFKPEIIDLEKVPLNLGDPELGDIVIKSGRTTKITYGKVNRVNTIVKIDYGHPKGVQEIGCFEIGVDNNNPPPNGEVSMGGDSGSVWMFTKNKRVSEVLAGLHFAGESVGAPEEFALACYAKSVFEKLEISLTQPKQISKVEQSIGYKVNFLDTIVGFPTLKPASVNDSVVLNGREIIDYVHFSLMLSKSRRFAHWVAWNIDGGRIKSLSRKGLKFKMDVRIPSNFQVGEDLYSNNRLDRGHIARRADLVWGSEMEAKQANRDSFYFTNIAPQMDNFNQSRAGGIWGRLENAVFEEVEVENLKVSVFGGPVFREDDRNYRGVKIPREFFKAIVYKENGKLKVKAFLLTQNLNQLEFLGLAEFKVYQVGLPEIEDRCEFTFPNELKSVDQYLENILGRPEMADKRPPLNTLADINW